MLPTPIDLDQAHDRHEEYAADALRARAFERRTATIRRAIGIRFIALGRRIAADQSLALARPR
jgi:hypothetical protein